MSSSHTDDSSRHDPFAALRQRSFQYYGASRIFSTLGQSLLQAVMAWQVYQISGSAVSLGLLGLARFFPALGASMVGGLIADTLDRRKVMIASQMVPFTCSIVLAAATVGGWVNLDLIFGLVVLIGLASSFENPARTSLLPAIVTVESFGNAVTVNNVVQKLGSVTGPTLAGFVMAQFGIGTAYVFYCVSMVAGVIPLLLVHYERAPVARQSNSLALVKEGINFVRGRQVLLGAMTLDMFAVIFGGAQALLPVYAKDILHAGESGYGLLSSSMQVGAFVAAFALVAFPPVKRTGRALIVTVGIYSVFTILFGLSRDFYLSLLLYGLLGAADQVSVVMRQTTIQMATPDELRGRVTSVNQVFVGASNQIGAMESGFVAALSTATFSVVSGGVGALAVALFIAWRLPQLWGYVSVHPGQRVEPADTPPSMEEATALAQGDAVAPDEAVPAAGG